MKHSSTRPWLGSALALTVGLALIGCNKPPEAPPAPPPPTTMGTKIDDAVVTTNIKTALLADADIKSFDIGVTTVQGVVQLSGFVNNQAQIDQAGTIARAAQGADSVRNDLLIKP